MHPPRTQHAPLRRSHAPNCLPFLQHFQTLRRSLAPRRRFRRLPLCRCDRRAPHRHSAHRRQRCSASAHHSVLRHAHHRIEQLTLSPQHFEAAQRAPSCASPPSVFTAPFAGAANFALAHHTSCMRSLHPPHARIAFALASRAAHPFVNNRSHILQRLNISVEKSCTALSSLAFSLLRTGAALHFAHHRSHRSTLTRAN